MILDGTLSESDRLAGIRGGNVQFLAAPDGTALWAPTPSPAPTRITAARIHALPAPYKAAAEGLPALAGKGHIGAGIGIRIPVHRPKDKPERHFMSTPVCSTPCHGTSGTRRKHHRRGASSGGAPSRTSRSAPAGSATSPAPHLYISFNSQAHRPYPLR
ncbi:hypothetical protein ACFU7T_10890 [Streptomyces sp. NPDC057555]|uniref:hypothetical protein n=1 Tax=Streptomyces sp. NPDC057555 TaxID=3346166 RepID=UPI0036828D2E